MLPASDTAWITEHAKRAGFAFCGVAPALNFPELAHTESWLAKGYAGEMKYLSDPRRSDPQKAFPEIRSVIICALNYNASQPRSIDAAADDDTGASAPRGWISRYAWGDDYHEVLREKLDLLVAAMRQRFTEPFESRAFADTGPLQERIFAKHAGMGWLGKNTLLLNQAMGSWFFLGTIVTSLDLHPSLAAAEAPPPDLCGSCTRCIDACPTDALVEPYVLDARRCISYLTIELRGAIPPELREPIGRHVFGCDICQDVCPWNRRAPVTAPPNFQPRRNKEHSLFSPELEWLISLTEEEFRDVFRGSPVKRAKWRGLVRNACVAIGNSGLRPGEPRHGEIRARLSELAASGDANLAEHARWALGRLEYSTNLPQVTASR